MGFEKQSSENFCVRFINLQRSNTDDVLGWWQGGRI
jgi:hypothetical protein